MTTKSPFDLHLSLFSSFAQPATESDCGRRNAAHQGRGKYMPTSLALRYRKPFVFVPPLFFWRNVCSWLLVSYKTHLGTNVVFKQLIVDCYRLSMFTVSSWRWERSFDGFSDSIDTRMAHRGRERILSGRRAERLPDTIYRSSVMVTTKIRASARLPRSRKPWGYRLRSGLIRKREVRPSLRRLCPFEAGGIIGRR